jgi:hypothetical protein
MERLGTSSGVETPTQQWVADEAHRVNEQILLGKQLVARLVVANEIPTM